MRKLPTGEPCAGEPPARFGGRGGREPFPTPINPVYVAHDLALLHDIRMGCVVREGHCRKQPTVQHRQRCSSKEEATGSDNRAFLSFYGTTLPRVERQNRGTDTGKRDWTNRLQRG